MRSTAVTHGAQTSRVVEAGPFRISTAVFPPRYAIASHFHDWSCVSVLLSGRFEQRFPGRLCDCPAGIVIGKPAAERHEDRWFDAWSRHLIIEIDPARHDELGPSRIVAEEIFHLGDIGAEHIARSAINELRTIDSVTPLALQGLVLQLFARIRRGTASKTGQRGSAPTWLQRVEDFLHEHFRSAIRLSDIAAQVGLHPDYLSRTFASTKGITIGDYVRQLRVHAAAALLADSDVSIAAIARRTGFADQSHLTRIFKRSVGTTPAQYRGECRKTMTDDGRR